MTLAINKNPPTVPLCVGRKQGTNFSYIRQVTAVACIVDNLVEMCKTHRLFLLPVKCAHAGKKLRMLSHCRRLSTVKTLNGNKICRCKTLVAAVPGSTKRVKKRLYPVFSYIENDYGKHRTHWAANTFTIT